MSESFPTIQTDVVIVGAGPAGASLACFLTSHNIKGIILELNSTSADTPRAHITNMAALECLRDIGLDQKAVKLATKDECMTHTRWCHSMAGREYGRIYSWGNDPARKGDYESTSPCAHCDLPQSLLEPELVRYATLNGFKIRWNTEYLKFEQNGSGVKVWAKDKLLEQEYIIEAKYLFGCDGARSRIATQIELPLIKKDGGGPAFNVLVRADLSHLIKHRNGNLHWTYQPDREPPDWAWLSIVRMVRPWDEWMFIILPKPGYDIASKPRLSNSEIEAEVRHLIGDETPLEVLRTNVWNINDIVAETYQKDRVFCLGDAVHRHPPFNGLGSNTCIQDAFNLAWKIAYVMQGKADPSLLDTFSPERQPVGQAVVSRANGGFREHFNVWEALGVTAPTFKERRAIFADLEADTPKGVARRKQFREAIHGTRYEFHGLGVEMNQTYNSSAVIGDLVPQGDEALPNPTLKNTDEILFHIPSTVPGRRLPHIWLSNAVPDGLISTIDIAGHGGFTLFTGIGGNAWRDAAKSIAEKYQVPIKVVSVGFGQDYEDLYFAWNDIRAIGETGCLLVRPDRFIAWRVKKLEGAEWAQQELGKTIGKILGTEKGTNGVAAS